MNSELRKQFDHELGDVGISGWFSPYVEVIDYNDITLDGVFSLRDLHRIVNLLDKYSEIERTWE